MKMTERDKVVLVQSARYLLWGGLFCWALSYSLWLGLAFTFYVFNYNKVGIFSPEALKEYRRDV